MKYAEGYTRLGWSIISMCSMKLPRPRVPGAMQRAALLRRTGTHAGESEQLERWAPAVRPKGAYHQWRKVPSRELSIDLVADERLVRVTVGMEPSSIGDT